MSTIKADVYEDLSAGTQVDSEYVVGGTAKAWANYDGVSNVFNNSLNLSSDTDRATGSFAFGFTNSMSYSDYSVGVTGSNADVDSGINIGTTIRDINTANSVYMKHGTNDATLNDVAQNMIQIWGALA